MAIDPRHDPRDQPIVQTHFDYRDNRVVLFQRHERPTEIILICHGIAPLIRGRRPRSLLYRTPHSISKRTMRRPTRQPLYEAFSVKLNFRSRAPQLISSGTTNRSEGSLPSGADQRAATLYSVGR